MKLENNNHQKLKLKLIQFICLKKLVKMDSKNKWAFLKNQCLIITSRKTLVQVELVIMKMKKNNFLFKINILKFFFFFIFIQLDSFNFKFYE